MSSKNFVHLHVHTDDSLRDGACKIGSLAQHLLETGQPGCAITDHGRMGNCYKAWKQFKSKGLKLIPGVEAYFVNDVNVKEPSQKYQAHMTLLAINNAGYKNLCALTSEASLQHVYWNPRCDYTMLDKYSEGVVVLTGCPKGMVYKSEQDGGKKVGCQFVSRMKEIFSKERVFVEAQRHEMASEQSVAYAAEIARRVNVPLIATNDVHYIKKTDYDLHQVVLCMADNIPLSVLRQRAFQYPRELYMKTLDEMASSFSLYPEAIENTMAVHDMCDVDLSFKEDFMPKFLGTREEEYSFLVNLVLEEARKRNIKSTGIYGDRIKHEMGIIKSLGYSGYFLIVWDMIRWGKSNGIGFGCGRGSVAGSLVCYLLGIHNIDPIKYNLFFERFINPSRVSPPDIDTDIEHTRRSDVVDYISNKYGRAYSIVTWSHIYGKSAIRDVGRALGYPLDLVNAIADAYPKPKQGEQIQFKAAMDATPTLQKYAKQYSQLFRMVYEIMDLKRHASKHAAGVVIVPENMDINQFCPLMKTKNTAIDPENGRKIVSEAVCTSIDMKDLDSIGLMKLDLLGLKTATMISELSRKTGIDAGTIPLNDRKTISIFNKGDTVGVFQCGRTGMREQFRLLKPTTFSDILIPIAGYRPGPMDYLPECYAVKRGDKVPQYIHPILEKILKPTYGLMLYQENVLEIVQKMAGYSLGEADIIRRAIGKKDPATLKANRDKFVTGCVNKKTITAEQANDMFDMIEKFAGYSFNAAHAASYSLNAWITAYFKAHFLIDFYVESANIKGDEELPLIIDDAEMHGVQFTYPSINDSEALFCANREHKKVYFALSKVKHVGVSKALHIVETRKKVGGKFASISDFIINVDPLIIDKSAMVALILSGAMDCFGIDRSDFYSSIDTILAPMKGMRKVSGYVDVFGITDMSGNMISKSSQPLTEFDKSMHEYQCMGMRLSDKVYDYMAEAKEIPQILQYKNRIRDIVCGEFNDNDTIIVGLVDAISTFNTKKGKPALVATITDLRQKLQVYFYNETYEKYAAAVTVGAWIVVQVTVKNGCVYANKVKVINTSTLKNTEVKI